MLALNAKPPSLTIYHGPEVQQHARHTGGVCDRRQSTGRAHAESLQLVFLLYTGAVPVSVIRVEMLC